MERDHAHVIDALGAARRIARFLEGVSPEAFLEDEEKQSAVLHQFTVLGEALRRVSAEFRGSHPSVAWSDAVSFRNLIVHEYDDGIGCDINKGAIQTASKRLRGIMDEQAAEASRRRVPVQPSMIEDESGRDESGRKDPLNPAQLSFTVWRVNDYDLQIQHNEAVALACDYLGVQRVRTDRFFDGTRGRSLVKIIPFDHPLSPVDIDLVRQELDARKDEDRPITLVCLGMELAAKAAIDDWNRLRKGKLAANRIDVIELRHDPKHGGWLDHKPAQADVSVSRKGGSLLVEVRNFISPSIVDRLRAQSGVLQPRIDDCRAMIDSIAIDTAYDGKTLNVVFADVPERRTDYVSGKYTLDAPASPTMVAVRITDMLGEEVLVTREV